LWVFTEDGFNRLDIESGKFRRYYLEETPQPGVHNRAFLTCLEDDEGNFWVGSYFRGLFLFDRNTGEYENFDLTRFSTMPGNVSLHEYVEPFQDRNGFIWMGTHNQGLFRYNPKAGVMDHFHTAAAGQYRLSNNIVYRILEDNSGLIWIGTEWGLNVFDPENERMSYYFTSLEDPSSISNNAVWSIMEDAQGPYGWEDGKDMLISGIESQKDLNHECRRE
jgi:ligand-binding sensor domain-containing protein